MRKLSFVLSLLLLLTSMCFIQASAENEKFEFKFDKVDEQAYDYVVTISSNIPFNTMLTTLGYSFSDVSLVNFEGIALDPKNESKIINLSDVNKEVWVNPEFTFGDDLNDFNLNSTVRISNKEAATKYNVIKINFNANQGARDKAPGEVIRLYFKNRLGTAINVADCFKIVGNASSTSENTIGISDFAGGYTSMEVTTSPTGFAYLGEAMGFTYLPRKELLWTDNITPVQNGETEIQEIVVFDEDGNDIKDRTLYILKGETLQLKAEILPEYAKSQMINWDSEGSVSVDNDGLVTAKEVGEASVTASTFDGKHSKIVKMIVESSDVKPNEIKILTNREGIEVGESYILEAEIYPENSTNRKIVWTVSDSQNAVIYGNKMLKALKPGTITVVAKAASDEKVMASLEITIYPSVPAEYSVASTSVLVPSTVYANEDFWGNNDYKIAFSAYDSNDLPINNEKLSQYYIVEFSDNFEQKQVQGISRNENIISVSPEATDVTGLQVNAVLKKKSDGSVILTAESNLFNVNGKPIITEVSVQGAEIVKSTGDKSYKEYFLLKMKESPLIVNVSANHDVYLSYQVNGGRVIKAENTLTFTPDLFDLENNTITVYIYNDSRPGANGYNYSAFIDKITIDISK